MMLNFDFDELYFFIRSSTCMSLFEKRLKLIKITKPNQTNYNWFDFDCLIGLVLSEKSPNQLEIDFSKK